jgi:dTDP-4-dehydrorhamnose reductase
MGIYDRILITGGGGMLAKALVRALRARDLDPIVLDRAALDITDDDQVRQVLEKSGLPTLVLNCAAFTKVDLCEEQPQVANAVNASGAAHLAKWATLYGVQRLVHFSTDFVFDGAARRPYRPDDPVHPLSAYGASKLQGEREIAALCPSGSLIIRTAWLYGVGGPCFPQTMISAARAGKQLKVVDDQTGSPTFTDDLATATLHLIDADARGIYHVTNSGQTNWHDFTAAILQEFDLKADLSRTTSADWKKLRPNSAIRPAYSVLDTTGYTQTTGKTMRPWPEALHAYHQAMDAP